MGTLLKNLPGLACETELAGLELEREPLQRALHAREAAPRIIERLADLSFHARLLVGLNALRNRAEMNGDDNLRFLVDSAQYYIEEVRGPAWDNPLVVACYYRDVARLEGRPFRHDDALTACDDYERDHQTLLEQMLAARDQAME